MRNRYYRRYLVHYYVGELSGITTVLIALWGPGLSGVERVAGMFCAFGIFFLRRRVCLDILIEGLGPDESAE